ncbi:MAG: hypothetical protein V1753_01200 [Pseudomonadota bacterium]
MIVIFPDLTLLIQIASFLLLVLMLNMVLYSPIRRMLQERSDKMAGLQKTADSLSSDADVNKNKFISKLNEARLNGYRRQESLKAEGAEEEKRIIDEMQQKLQGETDKVRTQIEKDIAGVRAALQKDIASFSTVIAGKVLGRSI